MVESNVEHTVQPVQPPSRIGRRRSARATIGTAITLCLGLAAGGSGLYRLASSRTPRGADLLIEPAEATISGDSPQRIELVVTNRRAKTVRIARVQTSCGCTVVKKPASPAIAPGAATTLTASATPPSLGEKPVRVEVYIEGEARPLVARITLKGRDPPVPAVNWQPLEVVARGAPGSEQVEKFELLSTEHKGSQPWISGAKCDSPGIKVELASPHEERGPSAATVRRKYPVSVAFTLEKPGRIRLGTISLELSSVPDGSAPRSIPVFSDCRPSVEAAPDTVFASVSPDELPKEIVVRFRAPLMSSPLELKPDPIEVAWLEVDEPRASGSPSLFCAELPIRITAIPAEGNGTPRRTTIRLRTNAPDCPLVEIPVYVQPKS
ncbi:MAG TPA: DUF1573 domain-containing protein [Pirellulales bacterium]|nr:DUF1573 domain-containing protein [Pirellulales bacterium]